MEQLFEFAFPLLLCLGVVATVPALLFGAGAFFWLLEYPNEARQRLESAFRPAPQAARATDEHHYYRPHWAEGKR